MRARFIFGALVAVVSFMPLAAQAAFPFLGPIIPPEHASCPAGWGMVIVVVNRIISFLLTFIIVFVAPLMIAWAGFLMVLSPTKAGDRSKAQTILWHMVIGVVIALAAYLIIALIMSVLYNKNAPDHKGGVLGAWEEIVVGDGSKLCIELKAASGTTPTPTVTPRLADVPLPPTGPGACDPAVVKTAAAKGAYPLTDAQANTLACIANPESTCGKNQQNYSWNKDTGNGKASTAFGAFQVTLSSNHRCFENRVCYQAAGVTGPLECYKGFNSKGFTTGGDPKIRAACMRAAADLTCNTVAAACVLQQNKGNFSPWTADKKKAVQQACINKYAGG